MEWAIAQSPATIANVCVGFDILGFAVPILSDRVKVRKIDSGVKIHRVEGIKLPLDPMKNTAGNGLLKMIEGEKIQFGFEIEIEKGIPLGSGLGGSAASAVAAVVAANALLEQPLTKEELLKYALYGESVASGGSLHGDNVVAALYGGLTMCIRSGPTAEEFKGVQLPIPDIHCVVVRPEITIETKAARNILADTILLKEHVKQSMALAIFMHAIHSKKPTILRGFFEDIIIEPQRAHLIPQFSEIKLISMQNGALGFSIAGAGPTMFGWFLTEKEVKRTERLYKEMGFQSWSCRISKEGAKVLQIG